MNVDSEYIKSVLQDPDRVCVSWLRGQINCDKVISYHELHPKDGTNLADLSQFANEYGWNGVDNSKNLFTFIKDELERAKFPGSKHRGEAIRSVHEIIQLANEKKAVWIDGMNPRFPAAFVQNFQAKDPAFTVILDYAWDPAFDSVITLDSRAALDKAMRDSRTGNASDEASPPANG